jgi:hypothetical protein
LTLLIAILTVALTAAVVIVLSAPLRSARRRSPPTGAGGPEPLSGPGDGGELGGADADGSSWLARAAERDELEAAREAKYREIRDAELDFRTGKLSREDYEAIDSDLRREAIEILDRIESED